MQVQFLEVRGPDDFENALPAAIRGRAGALIVVEDPLTFLYLKRIADFAAQNRLPATYGYREFAEAGGLITFGPNLADLYRRAAIYVDKIVKGAKPTDLPVEQPGGLAPRPAIRSDARAARRVRERTSRALVA